MEMDISGNWDKLTPSTQHWLTDNPGCVILPRTMAATICSETGGTADRDRHGGAPLSQDDRNFIADKARQAPPSGPGPRFFGVTST